MGLILREWGRRGDGEKGKRKGVYREGRGLRGAAMGGRGEVYDII